MKAVNLLPEEAKGGAARKVHPLLAAGAVACVAAVALLAMLTISASNTASSRQAEVDRLTAELAGIPPAIVQSTKPQDTQALVTERNLRIVAIDAALSRQVAWDRIMRQFALALPSDIWLTNLTLKAPAADSSATTGATGSSTTPGPAVTGTPTGVTISGYTYTQASVARMLTRMAAIPYFTNVQLQSSQLTQTSGRNAVQFTIAADLRTAGTSA